MTIRPNPLLAAVAAPPIPEAHSWIEGREFPPDRPLIDLAQAVPGYSPPPELTEHLARVVRQPATSRYTPIEGLGTLREALAADIGAAYRARIPPANVMITARCNQAFCLAALALAKPGDEIILPLPYYFNHQMWLEMQDIQAVHLPFRPDWGGVPDPRRAGALINSRTRAIVLVTPNNPTGAVYPPAVIAAFYELARQHRIALILDETYRDFLPEDGPPHELFGDPHWAETVVHLYSFSKVFCLTGYRVGAVVTSPALIAEIAKAMDCLAICAPHVGQEAALFGLGHLARWRRDNTNLMRSRLAALQRAFAQNDIGYQLISAGAYFAYVAHPFEGRKAAQIARRLAQEQNLLCLPGDMFGPGQDDYLRFAFANVSAEAITVVGMRLVESARAWA